VFHEDLNPENRDAESTSYESPWLNTDWEALADKELVNAINIANNLNTNKAKNVIMFLGDGMGLPTIASARIYNAQLNGLTHEDIYLEWEKFPHVGMSRVSELNGSLIHSIRLMTADMNNVYVFSTRR
jgi:alkaline phosphatase